jgi:lysophospholipid acyltransferase (LPLAT)-like uncharacterized protein
MLVPERMVTRLKCARRFRFFVLEKILLPLAIVPLRLLVRSWRLHLREASVLSEALAQPRLVFVTYHGMFLQLLAYAYLVPAAGRKLVVMLTPSLDGRLLAATLNRFGIDHVMATPTNRGIAGALEFSRRVEAGEVGLIAVDGPRGPACVVQKRALELARASNAEVYLAITSAGAGVRFGSWDCSHLPFPFVKTSLQVEKFASADNPDALQDAMIASATKMKSPVVAAAFDHS